MTRNYQRDLKDYVISDESYKKALKAFKKLYALRVLRDEKELEYKSKRNTPIEERISYKSSSDIENDVRSSGGSKRAPQEWPTMELKDEALALLKLEIKIADMETALIGALDTAASYASLGIRKKVREVLEVNLVQGIPASLLPPHLKIPPSTLAKFRRIAIIHAAINLEYVEKREVEVQAIAERHKSEVSVMDFVQA